MSDAIRDALKKYGVFSARQVATPPEESNLGELLVWTAERVAALGYFKIVSVVDNDYAHAKYPHAIVVPQDVSSEMITNRSDDVTYPVHVVMRILDQNPFRGVNQIAGLNVAVMKELKRTPNVENVELPERNSSFKTVIVKSAPILPSGRVAGEYQSTVRVEYTVEEPRLREKIYE